MLRPLLAIGLATSALAISSQQQTSLPSDPSTPLLSASESAELLSLHRHLVEIESITENEEAVADWLTTYLLSKNFTVEHQQVSPNRYNILAYGSKRNTTILVTSHIDTVPPYWPYYHNKTTDTIGGRGSVDAKGSVAPQILAVQGLRESLFDDLSLLFVVGEETGGDGMHTFSEWSDRPSSYEIIVFGEPTEGKLVCGHKGILSFNLKVTGKAAHSGYPWLGVSANDVLVEALSKLLELRDGGLPYSEKYGNTTMNFGQITGGVAGNVVAETASAKIAVRIAAGTPKVIQGLVIDSLSSLTASALEQHGATIELEWQGKGYPPVNIDCDIEGFETLTVNYGTDVPNLKLNDQGGDRSYKRYLYGPGSIFVAHSDHEALQRKELEQAVLDYRRIIVEASRVDHDRNDREEERMEM